MGWLHFLQVTLKLLIDWLIDINNSFLVFSWRIIFRMHWEHNPVVERLLHYFIQNDGARDLVFFFFPGRPPGWPKRRNGKWGNGEMETGVRAEPWVMYWRKSTAKLAGWFWQSGLRTRLYSLTVGISEYGWEFQQWQDCHRSRSHQHFWVRARGGEWLDISIPASLITFHTLLCICGL